jgi:L-seryl-tRNA(Ser) seleniumtransferase
LTVASPSPRDLPSVDRLLADPRVRDLPRNLALHAAREVLDEVRRAALNGGWPGSLDELPELVARRVDRAAEPRLRPVINATGVIIHTNLGRAPLSHSALQAAKEAAEGYSNLEYELDAGERGSRHALVSDMLKRLTGAEDALVTNNNAAAVLLILAALANGRQAIISRGQLIEIGGGFRIPDVMRQSGVELVEVGTTNRTYAHDYENAISERTALLLSVHASNFLQLGFVHQPTLADLVAVGVRGGVPIVEDLGSGSLLDTARFGLAREPLVQDSVQAGVDLVCFSGDKLLGGPQAGIVVGQAAAIATLRKHPLMRAIRPDKLTLASLSATLVHYVRGEAEREVPVWRMLSATDAELQRRARGLAERLGGEAVSTESAVGGGTLPGQTQPSWAVALSAQSADQLAASLRRSQLPVVGRVERERVLLDVRTVLPEQDALLEAAVRSAQP